MRYLVAVDGSEASERAVRYASRHAAAMGPIVR
ncbi:universal stress protein [Natronomonas moolapensis]|nr:universal stress protein [Natronomonas moolapensis]